MSVKAIREHDGKAILQRWLPEFSEGKHSVPCAGALVTPQVLDDTRGQTWHHILEANPWLKEQKLVAKPDQLIKRRGKAGLLTVNKTFEECKLWILDRMCKEQQVESVTGRLTHFIIEPSVPHTQEQEHYICMQSFRYHDEIFFFHEGGVDVGDVDEKAKKMKVPTGSDVAKGQIKDDLLQQLPNEKQDGMASFIYSLFKLYKELQFAYLEINPIVILDDGTVVPLDLAAKIDETAGFLAAPKWGDIDWPVPFGRDAYHEYELINDLY
jgi:ATP citrate (pro-S)-lyase